MVSEIIVVVEDHQVEKQQVEQQYNDELGPLYLRIICFLFLHKNYQLKIKHILNRQ